MGGLGPFVFQENPCCERGAGVEKEELLFKRVIRMGRSPMFDTWSYERHQRTTAAMMDALGRWEVARGQTELGRRLLLLARDIGLEPTESLMSPRSDNVLRLSPPNPHRVKGC